jgi:hypothetical protein
VRKPISVEYLKGQNRELIKLRLEEIAERFVKEGTPVILILGGLSGGDYAKEMNSEKNEYNLKYVTTEITVKCRRLRTILRTSLISGQKHC